MSLTLISGRPKLSLTATINAKEVLRTRLAGDTAEYKWDETFDMYVFCYLLRSDH